MSLPTIESDSEDTVMGVQDGLAKIGVTSIKEHLEVISRSDALLACSLEAWPTSVNALTAIVLSSPDDLARTSGICFHPDQDNLGATLASVVQFRERLFGLVFRPSHPEHGIEIYADESLRDLNDTVRDLLMAVGVEHSSIVWELHR